MRAAARATRFPGIRVGVMLLLLGGLSCADDEDGIPGGIASYYDQCVKDSVCRGSSVDDCLRGRAGAVLKAQVDPVEWARIQREAACYADARDCGDVARCKLPAHLEPCGSSFEASCDGQVAVTCERINYGGQNYRHVNRRNCAAIPGGSCQVTGEGPRCVSSECSSVIPVCDGQIALYCDGNVVERYENCDAAPNLTCWPGHGCVIWPELSCADHDCSGPFIKECVNGLQAWWDCRQVGADLQCVIDNRGNLGCGRPLKSEQCPDGRSEVSWCEAGERAATCVKGNELSDGCAGFLEAECEERSNRVYCNADPCAVALSEWSDVWEVRLESSGLSGRTPDINLVDVWGASADDIYAVGNQGTVLHYDGGGWSRLEAGTTADLEGVWGFTLQDEEGLETRREVFAAGSDGTIIRFDGTTWTTLPVINDPDPAQANPQSVTDTFHDLWGIRTWGTDPTTHQPTVLAVGADGLIARWEEIAAGRWEFREMRERVEFTDGSGNTRYSYQRFTPERLGGVVGFRDTEFVAAGSNGAILEYDGTLWRKVAREGDLVGFVSALHGVWGRGSWEVYAVGLDGAVLRGSYGGAWTRQDLEVPPAYLRGAWVFGQRCDRSATGQVVPEESTTWRFFTGWEGTLLVTHGNRTCPWPLPTGARLEGIWGAAPRGEGERTDEATGTVVCDPVEVVAVGVDGTIVRLINAGGI